MKRLFAIILLMLVIASAGTYWSYPQNQSNVPVLYWITGVGPARLRQIDRFHDWLIEEGHTRQDGTPIVRLEPDPGNRNISKLIIQGVSGIGDDVLETSFYTMRYIQAVGLLDDITDDASAMGFDPSQTYAALKPEIMVDGRQYTFPCNVGVLMYWANAETFRRYSQPLPPKRWTFEQFEEAGKRFVEAANEPDKPRRVFFASRMPWLMLMMHRSLGLSVFNETLTECTLDDERFAHCLALLQKWVHEDHILPSDAELEAMDVQSGFGGLGPQMFQRGNIALMLGGRYSLINLRRLGQMELQVVELPHGGYPNTFLITRGAGIYTGGHQKHLAKLFLSYLASEAYNMQLVTDADALPPNPAYAKTEAFLRPPEYPNEWGCHGAFFEAANEIGIATTYSPFALNRVVWRHVNDAQAAVLSNILSPKQAADQTAFRINSEIKRSVEENDRLGERYERLIETQKRIDDLRRHGKPVPLDWIDNPFYRRYYAEKGWAQ